MGFFNGWTGAMAAVNPVMLGANLLAGGADWIGAEKDRAANESFNRASMEQAQGFNSQQMQLAYDNMAMQREFAQNGVRWRIDDAATRGISPLAALGASGQGYSPVSAAFTSAQGYPSQPGASWRSLSTMGQNISRAVMATATAGERAEEARRLRNLDLQNELLESQVANARLEIMSKMSGPSFPSSTQMMRAPNGSLMVVPSDDFNRATAGNPFYGFEAWLENKFVPSHGSGGFYYGLGRYDPSGSSPSRRDVRGERFEWKP